MRETTKPKERRFIRIIRKTKLFLAACVMAVGPFLFGSPKAAQAPEYKKIKTRPIKIHSGVERHPIEDARRFRVSYLNMLRVRRALNEVIKERKAREEARKAAEAARIAREKRAREEAAARALREKQAREAAQREREEQNRNAEEQTKTQITAAATTQKTVAEQNVIRRTMSITAYTAGYESTQKHAGDVGYGITASGSYVQEGRTLACGPSIPLGARIEIPSLGISGICEDRGGAVGDDHIDVYMSSVERAQAFGRKTAEVIIYLP